MPRRKPDDAAPATGAASLRSWHASRMADKSSEQPKASTSEQSKASTSEPASTEQPATTQARSGAGPETFGDGSTREQQQEQIRAAEETNRQVKEFADAEREARSS